MTVTSVNQVCSYYGVCFNAGNASVTTFGYSFQNQDQTDYFPTSPVQYLHGADNGNTLVTPYGLAIDGAGNVWISNAGCVSTGTSSPCTPGAFVLSELVGAAAPTITPIAKQNTNYTQGQRPRAVPAPALTARVGRRR